jgi:hypothetical protein
MHPYFGHFSFVTRAATLSACRITANGTDADTCTRKPCTCKDTVSAPIRSLTMGAIVAAVLMALPLHAQVSITTNRYDGGRSGTNLNETTLTLARVNVAAFGRLWSYPVDGSVYAQPLYVPGVLIGGTPRNVLYISTMNDKVYAFDADSRSATPLWMRDFTSPPSVTAVPITDIVAANLNIVGNVGIQSTPVIDPATATIYLVARTKESGTYAQRLHALDIRTGLSRPGSPVKITGSVAGTAPDSSVDATGRRVTFNPKMQAQRTGLALSNGVVLIAWASHEDATPYHGWVMGYDASTLARVGAFCVTPDAYGGGIWQGGRAPTIDAAGNAYFATGNGKWDGTRNFGDSLLKFRVSRTALSLVDYFTPSNQAALDRDDDDLSGSGFTLLPGTNLLLGGGKEGVLYLLNSTSLGHLVPNDTQVVQKIRAGGHVMGGPVFWNSSTSGPLVYNWSEDDVLKAYQLSGGRLATPPFAEGGVMSPGHPGGSLTVSARGGTEGTAIVWVSMPTSQDGIHGKVAGILRAYDAGTLREIWTSEQNPARDRVGTLMKFVPPVVVNGRVYLPNHNGAVAVYGLFPTGTPDFSVAVVPGTRFIPAGSSGTFTVTVAAQNGFAGTVALSASGQPSGTAVTFTPSSIIGAGSTTMSVSRTATASGSFNLTVTGTSGTRVRSSAPVVVAGSTGTGAIGINFVGTSPTSMGPGETAGVVSKPHWNNAFGSSRSTGLPLVDELGAATSARVTWMSSRSWMTPATDAAGNRRLMKGYLDTTSTSTTTVSVTGLASQWHDVYVYADGDNRTYERSATYTLSGADITTTTVHLTDPPNTNFEGVFTRATESIGNYVKFRINAGEFTLTATPTAPQSGTRRAAVNAIQILPASEPARSVIGINFVGASSSIMAPAESAGVMPMTHWNNAAGTTRSAPLALIDGSGRATTVAITWTSHVGWMTPAVDRPGNARLMKGYLDTSSVSETRVSVVGLPFRAYSVYVYADGDNRTYTRSASYRISGAGITATTVSLTDPANTNFSGTFRQASGTSGNYVLFTISAGAFTLTATPGASTNATQRAPVNAIQIVPR